MVGVLLSLSRTGIINLLAITLPSLLLVRQGAKSAIRLTALIGVVLVAITAFSDFRERVIQRYSTLQSLQKEETWSGRIDIWQAAMRVFAERPFTGVGVGNFAFISPYYSTYAALISAQREDGGGGVAHNMFLSVMAETGVIGLIFFSTLLLSAYALAWRLIKGGENLAYGLLIGLLAYTVAGLALTWEYVKIPYLLYGSLLALRTRDGRHG
ncbi:O-antigen ligase family protein [Thermus scotoductus]|uniref:O-antigen ligase family protein n=1 Tax=Thermus scotoductus TaxID=37636 RepID=UPI0012917112|nr:O-antigen ligase family protein [Thermus scotoductus]